MKKVLFILTVFIISTQISTAQKWGLKGGLSISNLSSKDGEIDDRRALFGYTVGLQRDYEITDFFSIQPEISLTQKGAKYEDLTFDVKARSLYLEAPLVAKLKILQSFYLYAGPQISFLIDSRVTYKTIIGDVSFEDTDEENYRRADFGGCVGAGILIDRVFFDLRFSKGVIDFDKDRTIESTQIEAQNLKNFNAQITAGLKF